MITWYEIVNGISTFVKGTPLSSIRNANGSHTLVVYSDPSPLGASLDSFGRQRVSHPQNVFDAQFTYGLQPFVYEQIISGAGATIAHDVTNRCTLLSFAATPNNGRCLMQSFDYLRYQPGKSQEAFITFNHNGADVGVEKFARYGDDDNAIEYVLSENGPEMRLNSGTGLGDQAALQTGWNLDTLDGSGDDGNPSGILFDSTKVQILLLDFQALYVGRVRIGFDIDGGAIYVHEFDHANKVEFAYIQSANLPIACGMRAIADNATGTMRFYCSSVISEGGQDDTAGDELSTTVNKTAPNGSFAHALTLRPRMTFNGIVNRARFELLTIEISVLGNNPVRWELRIGQALTAPTFANVNMAVSAMEIDTVGTLNGSPAVTPSRGTVPASNQAQASVDRRSTAKYPITLNAAGANRVNGSLTLVVYGVGGASSVDVTAIWKEIK